MKISLFRIVQFALQDAKKRHTLIRAIMNMRGRKKLGAGRRKVRLAWIANSQRQGVEIAAARREAQKNGTMDEFRRSLHPL